jgi:serine/threonine-protein kinase
MITRLGVVKLGDFGIAKARKLLESREGDILMGKAEYMSPEQADYRETTPRSDIFSLGVVFYQLLTGVSVFGDDDTLVTLRKVSGAQVAPVGEHNPGVPKDLEDILMKALRRRPQDRFGSAGEMGYALEYYMYHDRFGPTNVTLEKYVAELFPEKATPPPLSLETTKKVPTVAVEIGNEGMLVIEDRPFEKAEGKKGAS